MSQATRGPSPGARPNDLGLQPNARVTVVETPELLRHGGKRAICSFATGDHVDYLAISGLTFVEYARRWGWNLVLSTEEDLPAGRPPSWAKVRLVRELLDEYDWVLWIDADAIVVDLEADIAEVVKPGKDLYIAETRSRKHAHLDPGVFLVRASSWSRELLDRVWGFERPGSVDEQAAINELIGYKRGKRASGDIDRVRLLGSEWNSSLRDPSAGPHLRHYGGEKRGRAAGLRADLARLRRGVYRPRAAVSRGEPDIARDLERLASRKELPALLTRHDLTGHGVEVGVFQGAFSEHILQCSAGRRLISIDPWCSDDPERYRDVSNVPQASQDANYEKTRARLARFGDRSEIWRMTSEEASKRIEDESLDFVYLDARHDEQSVTEDLRFWWGKVKAGGLLCGHDYLDGVRKQGVFGVKTAVDRFFGERALQVHVIEGIDAPWLSWAVAKPKCRAARTSGPAVLLDPDPSHLGLRPNARVTVVETPESLRRGGKRAICSFATGDHVDYLAISGLTFVDYAHRWGWDLVLSTEEDLPAGRPPSWAKVRLVRELLDEYDWVLWIDADAMIVDFEVDIGDVTEPRKHLFIVSREIGKGRAKLICGVFLLRASKWSLSLLDRVWAAEHLVEDPAWEQPAFMEALGYRRHRPPKKPHPRVKIIDSAWGTGRRNQVPHAHIKHYYASGGKRIRTLEREFMVVRARVESKLAEPGARDWRSG